MAAGMFYKANSKERKEVRPLLPAHGDHETRRCITPEPALIFDAEVIKETMQRANFILVH
ncbi:MAG: hypothetical protein CW344_12935 [Parageobacillus thermoglucosidasius]|nr:hypothetical protein [Parageobacillus thermoglucosidasius]